jgi:ASCH domain
MRLRDNRAVTQLLDAPVTVKIVADGNTKPFIGSRRSNHARPAGVEPKRNRPKSKRAEQPMPLADRATANSALRALSVRQPWAELILRGEKTIEYRSQPTKVRGKIYIYASATRYDPSEEEEFQADLDFPIDGYLVG